MNNPFPGIGASLDELVDESIQFLREHEPEEGYFVGFSGGKDSIVTLELCHMAGVKFYPYYSCTRIDPPELVRFIRKHYPEVKWLYPAMSFWEAIQKKSPPLRMRRWCCDLLKKDPSKNIGLHHRVMGIRAEESVRRAGRPRMDNVKKSGVSLYKPIFYWQEWAIWEFIEGCDLPYPSLYDEGFGRIGCIVCPFIMGKRRGAVMNRERSMKRWPGVWKAFEHACKRWWSARSENRTEKSAEEYWQKYLNGFE